ESAAFVRLRQTARRRDAQKTYFALLAWLERFAPLAPDHTVARLRAAAQDPLLDQQLVLIERRLFAAATTETDAGWSPRPLLRRPEAARRRLRRQRVARRGAPLPAGLNPSEPPVAVGVRRRVAR